MGILIGLTGWGDHDSIYNEPGSTKNKLATYSSHFPVVEVDSSFYAIQPQKNYSKWVRETPNRFSFVIKAHQTMTGHDRSVLTHKQARDLFDRYLESIEPVMVANKLNAILFQFPPWFNLTQSNITKLRKIKSWYSELPIALEFRNRSWFSDIYKQETLAFMKEEGWIHSICDEPQAGEGSVPIVAEPTNKEKTIIRFHGRNVHTWNRNGLDNWREVRFLYRYNKDELQEWVSRLDYIVNHSSEVTILFNNNSGGDAATNAKELMDILNIEYSNLNPHQMNLFNLGE